MMRFGVCGIEFRNIYKNKLFYMLFSVSESASIVLVKYIFFVVYVARSKFSWRKG